MEKIFNIVYQTVNTVNKKIYIGIHQTATLDFDGYIGNGIWINQPYESKNTSLESSEKIRNICFYKNYFKNI